MADPTGRPGLLPLLDGYQYDVFLSYRRSGPGNAAAWVRDHFHRMLEDCLADELGLTAVFIDKEVETGSMWPPLLREVLARSKMLVAVWSPPYFHSPWCLAEWRTMEERERVLGGTVRLVYPVRYSDGDNFPEGAKQRQHFDVREVSNPFPAFHGSHRQADLFETVKVIAGEVAQALAAVPPWRADWPECQVPDAVATPKPVFPVFQP
ncbi:TIR domain-containing protein [Lentzea sp. NPDC058450]|uniref:TIR domain-containing protein n=1 Tax=Lentzea sp. NPDC058450 TaxID=3346505 RepID=UPI0036610733